MRADAPVRSLVLWFPDWPVTALTRDASRSVPLDRLAADRRDGAQRRRRVLRGGPGRGRAARAAPPRRAGALPEPDGDRGRPGARPPRLRADRRRHRRSRARGADRAARALRPARPRPRAVLRGRGRGGARAARRAARTRSRGRAGGHRRRSVHGRAGGAHRGDRRPNPCSSCRPGAPPASSRRCPSPRSKTPSSPDSSRGSACRRSGSSRRWRQTACASGSASAASVCTRSRRAAIRAPSSPACRRPNCTARSGSSRRSRSPTRSRSACGWPPTRSSPGSAPSTWSAPSCGSS